MRMLKDYESIYATEVLDEAQGRAEAATSTAPTGATETPATVLPGTGEPKPITEKGDPGPMTPAQELAAQQELDLKAAKEQQDILNQQIAQQAVLYQQNQQAILQAQQQATNALSQGFLSLSAQQTEAMAKAEQLRKNTGQASRKPNYSVSLKANKAANAGGVTSTMLTGPGGVSSAALPLGKATVLGS